MRRLATAVAAALVVLSVVAPAAALPTADGGGAAAGPSTAPTNGSASAPVQTSGDAPPDPDGDRLGWENGYWYNESIDVDASDGLDDAEMEAVVARSMARVEVVRGLEFERTVSVEVLTREEFRAENREGFNDTTESDGLHQNVKYEALFMVNETTDAVAVQRRNRGASVGGFYDPREERIVVVSENAESPRVDEITLSQELFHALQDQKFNLSGYNQSTRERHNAIDGIVEGDGNYVDYLYQQRCELSSDDPDYWGDCLEDVPGGNASGGGELANFGIYLVVYQPYSDGPPFVRGLHRERGWEAVNAIYEDPPASTEQTIHPEKYGEDAQTNVSLEDRSNERWRPLTVNGSVDYAELGEAGLASMFIYPAYDPRVREPLVPPEQFLNTNESGDVDRFDPLNYSSRYSAGWDGDRLQPYVTDESAETNETGYVWKLAWDSPDEAEEFAEGYRRLLELRGAERVGENTYVIPEDGGDGFADAFHVTVEGNTTTVVNAPSVEELSDVDGSIDPQTGENASGTDSGDGTGSGSDGDGGTSDGAGPGFGPAAAVVALAAGALLALRRVE